MRILIAGASGVLGTRLVQLLTSQGHRVIGMTRSPSKLELLRSLGADPVVCNVFDSRALQEVVKLARPEVIIDELTDLPDDPARIQEFGVLNNRIRREGTANILAAAKEVGVNRVLVQSVAWTLPGDGEWAIRDLERMVLEAGGLVLRYGQLYGPGTYYIEKLPSPPRVQIDEAARRTVAALNANPGIVTIEDSDGS